MEIWAPIPGHDGYEASDQGRIRSRRRILKQFTLRNGYKTTHLGRKHMNNYVHHLVMRAFKGPTPVGMEICHNDGNKSNPQLSNLRFDTRIANMADVKLHAIMAVVDRHRWIWPAD